MLWHLNLEIVTSLLDTFRSSWCWLLFYFIKPWVGVYWLALDVQVVFCHHCWAFVNWLTRSIENPEKKRYEKRRRGGGGVKQIFSWYIWVTSLTFLTCLLTQVCGECHQWTHKLFSWHQFQRFPQTPGYKLLLQTHVFSALSLFYLTCTTALFPETSRTWPALGYGDLYLWWVRKTTCS